MTDSGPSLPLTGGCVCGGVRYEIDEPLAGSGYCHCTRCQRRTGTAASANGETAPGSLRIVQGAELVSEWTPDGGFTKAFCSRCGSALWSLDPASPGRKASGSARSTPTRASGRPTASTWPTRWPGRPCRTTGWRSMPSRAHGQLTRRSSRRAAGSHAGGFRRERTDRVPESN